MSSPRYQDRDGRPMNPEDHPNWKRPLPFGVVTSQGRREANEDTYTTKASRCGTYKFFAVFDGHGGVRTANFCKNRLHELVFSHLASGDPQNALGNAFLECDTEYCRIPAPVIAGPQPASTGTTALAALVIDNTLYVANAGDSRCVLCTSSGRPIALSVDHKPGSQSELNRIQEMGGSVSFVAGAYRVNGELAVSRAIGDPDFKPYVTAKPEISVTKVQPGHMFMILGSDGVWDVVRNEDAAHIVGGCRSPQEAAERIVQEAFKRGTTDNLTALVVDLRPLAQAGNQHRGRAAPPPPSRGSTSSSQQRTRQPAPNHAQQQQHHTQQQYQHPATVVRSRGDDRRSMQGSMDSSMGSYHSSLQYGYSSHSRDSGHSFSRDDPAEPRHATTIARQPFRQPVGTSSRHISATTVQPRHFDRSQGVGMVHGGATPRSSTTVVPRPQRPATANPHAVPRQAEPTRRPNTASSRPMQQPTSRRVPQQQAMPQQQGQPSRQRVATTVAPSRRHHQMDAWNPWTGQMMGMGGMGGMGGMQMQMGGFGFPHGGFGGFPMY